MGIVFVRQTFVCDRLNLDEFCQELKRIMTNIRTRRRRQQTHKQTRIRNTNNKNNKKNTTNKKNKKQKRKEAENCMKITRTSSKKEMNLL